MFILSQHANEVHFCWYIGYQIIVQNLICLHMYDSIISLFYLIFFAFDFLLQCTFTLVLTKQTSKEC